jgi:hypothetical protein
LCAVAETLARAAAAVLHRRCCSAVENSVPELRKKVRMPPVPLVVDLVDRSA